MDSKPAVQKGEVSPRVIRNGDSSATGGDARAQGPEIFSETGAARHNDELVGPASNGTYGWRNQADGFFE